MYGLKPKRPAPPPPPQGGGVRRSPCRGGLWDYEQAELIRCLQALLPPRQRPSQTLQVFHVEHFPEHMSLRREDEYDDGDH